MDIPSSKKQFSQPPSPGELEILVPLAPLRPSNLFVPQELVQGHFRRLSFAWGQSTMKTLADTIKGRVGPTRPV
ncbi:hypothetical protein BOTBODRAFT_182403 [Botryobasidium botryosum FD-172 SS1]|uniref:Uncharacterized protein n=1 Tax=Botryobasidium botryosum (strain FD-172 SS1) TaxID=930990 RepID=A0A067LTN5_BOTB1|nr:hypothetical protein BOTBODRAFT_182403 [Botryobasidium botryosum FD-172 SS1]